MTDPIHDLAQIGHAERLTPFAEESLRVFVEQFGMEIEAREGPSVYLRGWGDYQRHSLKPTESGLPARCDERRPPADPRPDRELGAVARRR